MVKVREEFPVLDSGVIDLNSWHKRLNFYNKNNVEDENKFYSFISQLLELVNSNKLSLEKLTYSLMLVEVLDEMGLGADTLMAGAAWGAMHSDAIDFIEPFNMPQLSSLIQELDKFDDLSNKNLTADADNIDKIRRMMLAVVDDIRVVMIKLAEHTCLMRISTKKAPEVKMLLAELTNNIYAPLANRLGIGQLKWELEDLSFRFTEPDTYKNIAKLLDERRVDREDYIKQVTFELEQKLFTNNIKAKVSGRAKHIYSIWKKMKRKMVSYNEIYDVRALRVITSTIADCYAALGIVHSLWQNIPNEFDDYIANPKSNGYQSLHTAVIGPKGRVIEIQIRTQEMHEFADLGIAAHWRYKEGVKYDEIYQQKISEIRQLLSWQESESSDNVAEDIRQELFEDRVYVLTPTGDIVDLPHNATPVDFAYSIHTEVGHRCRGAKVDGKMVPLSTPLQSGVMVEVLTAKAGGPSRDWLNPSLSFIKSARSRAKVQSWFRKQDREQNAIDGKDILLKELKRLSLDKLSIAEIVELYPNANSEEDLFAGIAIGDIKLNSVVNLLSRHFALKKEQEIPVEKLIVTRKKPTPDKPKSKELNIQGVTGLLYRTAKCCNPLPGEDIVGYVTVGAGVSVHRKDCANIINAQEHHKNRMIEVNWGETAKSYEVRVEVLAYQRSSLLKDITSVLASSQVDIAAIDSTTESSGTKIKYRMTWYVESIENLSSTLTKVQSLPNVLDARRVLQ